MKNVKCEMLKPKKSLGQNFLKDKNIAKKIVAAADLQPIDFVIEIGPGEGILTEELAKKAGRVLAVEIDQNLIPDLQQKFSKYKNVEIINEDVLKINLSEIFSQYKLKTTNYKLIANIPYYITSKIIRLFLESSTPPQEMILMVQKEVAERIVAHSSEIPAVGRGATRISRSKPGKMSLLAVSVQYFAQPKILFPVSRGSFSPVPAVDSAVIKISNFEFRISNLERKKFFRVVKAGFSAKRKTLANNLANSFHLDKKDVVEKIKNAGLPPTSRAQELSIDDWKKLANLFLK